MSVSSAGHSSDSASSFFRDAANGDFHLVYDASSNREYYVWMTESLTNTWTRYSETPVPGNGAIQEYPVAVSNQPNSFFKLEVAVP